MSLSVTMTQGRATRGSGGGSTSGAVRLSRGAMRAMSNHLLTTLGTVRTTVSLSTTQFSACQGELRPAAHRKPARRRRRQWIDAPMTVSAHSTDSTIADGGMSDAARASGRTRAALACVRRARSPMISAWWPCRDAGLLEDKDAAVEVTGSNTDQADIARLFRLAEGERCLVTTETDLLIVGKHARDLRRFVVDGSSGAPCDDAGQQAVAGRAAPVLAVLNSGEFVDQAPLQVDATLPRPADEAGRLTTAGPIHLNTSLE